VIIKGASRGEPKWLGRHLMRRDTNERIEVLELQSPHADLTEALRDWQVLAAGTRGFKGLYHANIDPAIGYAMTPEQWQRAVEVLERELKLEGQPRAVVLHEKLGRQHVHVVWSRTDLETMTLKSDSHNFYAHERASLALELEFGHEHVPGRHAKRDRERQHLPPGAALTHAEWQQAERSGLDPRAVRTEIDHLFRHCDTGPAFAAALADAGFALARGDRRDFVIVDQGGGTHPLGRAVQGFRAAAQREFMQEVARDELPSVAEARAQQQDRAPRAEPKIPQDPTAAAALEAQAARVAAEVKALEAAHAVERQRAAAARDAEIAAESARRRQEEVAALARHDREAESRGFRRFVESVRGFFSPAWAKDQAVARQDARRGVETSLTEEREEALAALTGRREADLAALAGQQGEAIRAHQERAERQASRYLGHLEALREAAEAERQQARRREDREPPDREDPTRAR
jgi:hypothetical protein